jgi:hypothetical protein
MANSCLKEDVLKVEWLLLKCRSSNKYAQNFYAALCNNIFCKCEQEWSCSWRASGDIVAKMVGKGSYLDWYCSGMFPENGFIEEGSITSEISSDLLNLGWTACHDKI